MKPLSIIIICLIPFIFLNIEVKAQLGVRAGVNVASIFYTDTNMDPNLSYDIDLRPFLGYDIMWLQLGDQKPIVCPIIGIYYNWQFANRFAIRSGIEYTQKGVNFSQYEYEEITYRVKINYLELPVSIAATIVNKERFKFDFYSGTFGAFKLNAFKKVETATSDLKKSEVKNVQNWDAGLLFGIDFKFKVKENFLVLDISNLVGLKDIYKQVSDDPILYNNIQKIKTTSFVITIGYEF